MPVPKKKKVVVKKRVTVKRKPKLVIAGGEHCFWVHDGPVLRSLHDLAPAFKKMSPAQFAHHVTKEKNDFASWIQYVLLDPTCAQKMRRYTTAKAAHGCVVSALKKYRIN